MAETVAELGISLVIFRFVLCTSLFTSSICHKIQYKRDIYWPTDTSYFSAPIFSAAVDPSNGDVFVAKRNLNSSSILLFSKEGAYKKTLITGNTLEQVHGLTFQKDARSGQCSLWATDVGNGSYGYTVKQYSLMGTLLQVLGTPGVPGDSLHPVQFGNVAEVAFDFGDSLYIVDGDGGVNNRLLKYSPKFLFQWSIGQNGSSKYEFRIPHSVAVSHRTGNIWIADRMNNRLQVYGSAKPYFVGGCTMQGGEPYSVRFSADESHLIVTQLQNDTVALVSSHLDINKDSTQPCNILGTVNLSPGVKPHLVDVDIKSGAFYVAEIGVPSCQKFVPVQ